ncbi:MAG: S41 family peptidase [Myxococcales bacterium]|nr:S41 family peptidase [Myxococcales bacterium]
MNRWLRPALAIFAIGAATCITFVWPKQNGLDFDIDTSPRAQAAKRRVPYDLSEVRVLKTVITKVNQNYVEPERIDHRNMLLAGLNAIQRVIPPVLVHYDRGDPKFRLQVNDVFKEFRADDVNSPWSLTWRFQDIFKFLQKNLQQEDVKLRDVEYAAVNGMLRTLDPHSVLLTPEEYSEMQLSTRGEFGGLGIVISIRDGQLTIIRPMPGTPAFRAGLKKKDRIVKINDESTLNMPLEEAVSRLRGSPGSKVAVWIVREGAKGFTKPRRFELTRAVIHIDSVESRMLSDAIGYLRISNFQSNTCDDMKAALRKMHKERMRGLVLDLRDNPGGLLQQAVCVADTYLSSGTIVTTSSNDPDKRERKLARSEGTQPFYPVVVLQNGGSASASEIVAGALKNHDRALIVGDRTFGKGSVQVLYSDDTDGWALKLTIAQYLTPGDISIQSVGIVPDIEIEPMTVDKDDLDLHGHSGYLRESDLTAHLTHVRARDGQKPSHVLRYYLPKETRQRLREASPDEMEENEREAEFLTRFARELLSLATRPGRRELLRDAEPVIEATVSKEMTRAEAELAKLGVDWSLGEDQGASDVEVEVSTNRKDHIGRAGEAFDLRVSVHNKGKAPLYRLRAVTHSDNRLFHERELIFGKLAPGERRSWSTTLGVCRSEDEDKKRECVLPKTLSDRADGIKVEFDEAHGHAPKSAEIRTQVHAIDAPQFAYTLHVADDARGNGDGKVQRGEMATVYLRIKNTGKGVSEETVANLRNVSGRGVLLHAGRFQLEKLGAGQERMVAFKFEVLEDFTEAEAKLEVSVGDSVMQVSAGEKFQVPVGEAPGAERRPAEATGPVNARAGAAVLESPESDAKVVARVAKAAIALPAQARLGKYTRVDLGGGRPGWVHEQDLLPAAAAGGRVDDVIAHRPPHVEVDHGGALVTTKPTLRVRGQATDDRIVRDLYIFVGPHKVYYLSNRSDGSPERAAFDTTVPLRPGINYVTVVAREDNEVMGRETFIVRRDGPDGALLETPKGDDLDPFFDTDGLEP